MYVTIYKNKSDKKVIGKTLTNVADLTCNTLDDCSIMKPQIIVGWNQNILGANYAFINQFNRYYFIDNITITKGQRMILDLSIDVLETYNTQIKSLTCIVKRNANSYNLYLDDPYFQTTNKRQVVTKNFPTTAFYPNALTNLPSYLLTIAKGGNT